MSEARLFRAMDRANERAKAVYSSETAMGGYTNDGRGIVAGTDLPWDCLFAQAVGVAEDQLRAVSDGEVDPVRAIIGIYISAVVTGVLFARDGGAE